MVQDSTANKPVTCKQVLSQQLFHYQSKFLKQAKNAFV